MLKNFEEGEKDIYKYEQKGKKLWLVKACIEVICSRFLANLYVTLSPEQKKFLGESRTTWEPWTLWNNKGPY